MIIFLCKIMDNFLKIKVFVPYLFFKNRKISIFVEKSNMLSKGICVFACPLVVEPEVYLRVSVILDGWGAK